MRMLQRVGLFLLSPFLWPTKQIVLDANYQWALEMELDLEEPQSRNHPIFIAEVARFPAGEVECGRWAYAPPGIWRRLEGFSVPLDKENQNRYENYYYLQTGERPDLGMRALVAADSQDTSR
jgi:hypothetical protein